MHTDLSGIAVFYSNGCLNGGGCQATRCCYAALTCSICGLSKWHHQKQQSCLNPLQPPRLECREQFLSKAAAGLHAQLSGSRA